MGRIRRFREPHPVAWAQGYEGDCPPPHFRQNADRDFLDIDEKIGVRMGSSKSSEKKRAWSNNFDLCPLTFIALATPLVRCRVRTVAWKSLS